MTNENEKLIERIRESKIQGPFNLDIKESVMLDYQGLGPLTPILKRWEREKFYPQRDLDSSQDLADYLKQQYLGKNMSQWSVERGGYNWMLVNERPGLTGGLVLKLRSVPHPDSESARNNSPPYHIWLKIKPSPLTK